MTGVCAYTWRWEPHWVEFIKVPLPVANLPAGLIGGRIVPSFTLNALRKQGRPAELRPLPGVDRAAVLSLLAVALVDLAAEGTALAGIVALAAAVLTLLRLSRWHGLDTLGQPILWVLHLAYLFIPLSTVGLRSLPSAEIAKGSGMYNLFRMLGGSFGIAILSTILDRRADAHLSALAGHVGPFEGPTVARVGALSERFINSGLDPDQAAMAARIALDRALHATATMQAFYDAYFFIGMLFILALPAAFLLARHAPGKHAPILD